MKIKIKYDYNSVEPRLTLRFAFMPRFVWGDTDRSQRYIIWFRPFISAKKWNNTWGSWTPIGEYLPEVFKDETGVK